ncbi:DUF1775 domain-containing protein [Streptomyces sp. NPDC058001]|uniref:DUF1775 domain-containing protein n=1 Tax=Streptomyces sp. NPDC058001 TaxID=3346300 RepID=UPI0036EF2EE6
MPRHDLTRAARRTGLAGAIALAAGLAMAGTAYAHVEVTADTPQALAENVTLNFTSEAESGSAGFTEVRIVLPKGITPGDVSLDSAPKGWKFKATADGYAVAGPKLPVGTDAVHKVTVRQLPDADELAFKAVETYSDGEVSRWIELPSGDKEPAQPAPLLKLKAAAPGAAPLSPSPTASPTAPSTPPPSSTPSPEGTPSPSDAKNAADDSGDGPSSALLITGGVAAALVVGGGIWWFTRRGRTPGEDS